MGDGGADDDDAVAKKGSSILGECFAALAEMLYGSYFGPAVLLSGFVQGLGSEAGFMVTRYRRYDAVSLCTQRLGPRCSVLPTSISNLDTALTILA